MPEEMSNYLARHLDQINYSLERKVLVGMFLWIDSTERKAFMFYVTSWIIIIMKIINKYKYPPWQKKNNKEQASKPSAKNSRCRIHYLTNENQELLRTVHPFSSRPGNPTHRDILKYFISILPSK